MSNRLYHCHSLFHTTFTAMENIHAAERNKDIQMYSSLRSRVTLYFEAQLVIAVQSRHNKLVVALKINKKTTFCLFYLSFSLYLSFYYSTIYIYCAFHNT